MDEESIIHETFSHSSFQEEDFQDVVDDRIIGSMVVDSFDVSNSYCDDEIVFPNFHEDQVVHVHPFSEEHHEMKVYEFQDSEFFNDQPIYDEFEGDKEQISIPTHMEFCHSDPVYDSYESESWEGSEGDDAKLPNQSTVCFLLRRMLTKTSRS